MGSTITSFHTHFQNYKNGARKVSKIHPNKCNHSRHLPTGSGIFIVNFEHISHLVLVFLLLTLNMQLPAGMSIKNDFIVALTLSDTMEWKT